MNPAPDIASFLAASPQETAAATEGRVYWPFAPTEPDKPYVCVRLAQTRRMDPAIDRTGGMLECVIEMLIFAESQSAAWSVADAVSTDLDNRRGVTGSVTLKQCVITNALDLVSEELFDRGIFAVEMTAMVKV